MLCTSNTEGRHVALDTLQALHTLQAGGTAKP
jgi:hypothetical protein